MTALPLALSDYKRYGRQMILDGFGLEGMSPLLLEGVLMSNRHESDSKSPA
jgi:molybdopterin/thiamine biosynthesis adenylyltransferase